MRSLTLVQRTTRRATSLPANANPPMPAGTPATRLTSRMSRLSSESGTSKNYLSSTRWTVMPPCSVCARSVMTWLYGRGRRGAAGAPPCGGAPAAGFCAGGGWVGGTWEAAGLTTAAVDEDADKQGNTETGHEAGWRVEVGCAICVPAMARARANAFLTHPLWRATGRNTTYDRWDFYP